MTLSNEIISNLNQYGNLPISKLTQLSRITRFESRMAQACRILEDEHRIRFNGPSSGYKLLNH